jgi:hypothetical protein
MVAFDDNGAGNLTVGLSLNLWAGVDQPSAVGHGGRGVNRARCVEMTELRSSSPVSHEH